jgi:O-antigen ligase/tetratricopeptide (TPR) repeat protein
MRESSPAAPPTLRTRFERYLCAAMETLVILLVTLAPWAFGAVHPATELVLYAGLALVLALWGVRMLVQKALILRRCPVMLCLAGLFIVGVLQIVPLSPALLQRASPATTELLQRLLPSEHEVVSGTHVSGPDEPAPGATISLYPGATRAALLPLLALFALFAVVRNNMTSVASVRRLAIAAVINGVMLSLFALVQFFTSQHHEVYWHFPSQGQVFGPFICRNHFPFYVNLCIGLGLGLLLCSGHRRDDWASGLGDSAGFKSVRSFVNNPLAPWIAACLALMAATVVCSLSRGGALSLLGAGAACLLARWSFSSRGIGLGTGVIIVALTLGLVAWLGFDLAERRLSTLWRADVLQEDRFHLWRRVLPLAGQFPIWGTGYGTFQYVEPLRRAPTDTLNITYDHAHNDYLEALIEGGAVMLGLVLVATILVYRRGLQIMRCAPDSTRAGMALGSLFGLTAVGLHSFGDFGLHVPAVAMLLTVVAAQLCGLRDAQEAASEVQPSDGDSFRVRGIGPVVGAAALIAIGFILMEGGQRQERAERYRLAALRCRPNGDASSQERRLKYLEAASAAAPDDATLHIDFAEALHEHYQEQSAKLRNRNQLLFVAQAILSVRPEGREQPAVSAALCWVGGSSSYWSEQLAREHPGRALLHFVWARDLCPLLAQPHVRLAGYASELTRAGSPTEHLRRAQFVAPNDPRVWYVSGLEALANGRLEEAWPAFQRSLLCADEYLAEILTRGAAYLDAAGIVDCVLPAKPQLLLAAARWCEGAAGRDPRPFLVEAIALLERQESTSATLHLKAQAHSLLNHPREAQAAYQAALALEPQQAAWRLELARLLAKEKLLQESRRELLIVLQQEPGHAEARELYLAVVNDIAALH